MIKTKRTKGQTTIYKTLHKNERSSKKRTRTLLKTGVNSRKSSSSCSTGDTLKICNKNASIKVYATFFTM